MKQRPLVESKVFNVQLVELKLPVPLLLQFTVPAGVVGEPELSFTVTVHVEVPPTETESGLQVTEVMVVLAVTVGGKETETGGGVTHVCPFHTFVPQLHMNWAVCEP
jgi:hypothetical protein